MKEINGMGITSTVIVKKEEYLVINAIHAANVGHCPSGRIFDKAAFLREIAKTFPGHEVSYHGRTSKLPWGDVSDYMYILPSNELDSNGAIKDKQCTNLQKSSKKRATE